MQWRGSRYTGVGHHRTLVWVTVRRRESAQQRESRYSAVGHRVPPGVTIHQWGHDMLAGAAVQWWG